jgi:hypothetical protein
MTEYTYEEFQKRIEHWSFTHQVEFLMQGNWWCDEIIAFIKKVWRRQDDDFSEEDVDTWELLNVKAEPRISLKKKYDDLDLRYHELLLTCSEQKRKYEQLYEMYNNLLNQQVKDE